MIYCNVEKKRSFFIKLFSIHSNWLLTNVLITCEQLRDHEDMKRLKRQFLKLPLILAH